MSKSKTKKIVSIAALVLCLALAAVFVFAFAGCDEENASADAEDEPMEDWITDTGLVSGEYTIDEFGRKIYVAPETADSEFVETAYIENGNVSDVSEFDKNGVATCVYGGKSMYLTLGGGVYDFYPYCFTIAPIATSAETAGIQVSLIFDEEPAIKGKFIGTEIRYIEVGSPAGEPLDVSKIAYRWGLVYANFTDDDGNLLVYTTDSYAINCVETTPAGAADAVKIYGRGGYSGFYDVLYIELGNGDSYAYGFTVVDRAVFSKAPDVDAEEDVESYDEEGLSRLA